MCILTLAAGVLPAAIAYVGAKIVDAVLAAISQPDSTAHGTAFGWVVVEGLLVACMAATQRAVTLLQHLLRGQLSQHVFEMIAKKALAMELAQFEDADIYDKLVRARQEAPTRPISIIRHIFALIQSVVSLCTFGAILVSFSPWTVATLLLCGLPAFLAESKFSGDAFLLHRWRSPEGRKQLYLENVALDDDHVKEVKLFGLGPLLLKRHRDIYSNLYAADKKLLVGRNTWGFFLGLIGTAALYSVYASIVMAAIAAQITLGQMTMYLMLFRQGQSAISAGLAAVGGMYEDNLYLSILFDYLRTPVKQRSGADSVGPMQDDGIRFEKVSFRYPGSEEFALVDIDLRIKPGESLAIVGTNGSGKSTLIKLLTRLYEPTSGRILLDGLDLQEWSESALRDRVGVIFQDFVHYNWLVGENIGVGDADYFEDESRWREAAVKGMAAPFITSLPSGYRTQLGKWFRSGRQLSGGQWQAIALARAFMRTRADILVLDEPTSAMDASVEADVFESFRERSLGKIAILISHRFSTVRMADRIIVVEGGRIVERGNHDELMRAGERYARLFSIQASGYR
ncbi:ABC transporter ATP-binding protein/permease [Lysobacter sp. TLK-CK17T]|uniref:ABC transporter ATP-binding protein/permease n=2 Tax=Marilutibacter chinensis TaxID=2912247 RepID=A0ABS9HZF7_9GAMM|nr:ABC transporter ATP-binding protein/permease [Lysobacter chinensis]